MYTQLLIALCAISAIAAREQCPKPKTNVKVTLPELKGTWHLHAILNFGVTWMEAPGCLAVHVEKEESGKAPVIFATHMFNTSIYLRSNLSVVNTQPPRLMVGAPKASLKIENFFVQIPINNKISTNVVMFDSKEHIVLWSCVRRYFYNAEQAAIFLRKPERNEETIQKIQKKLEESELPHERFTYIRNPQLCDEIEMPSSQ